MINQPSLPNLPRIALVVLDFDETLYDWIGYFVPALEAMITTAASELGTTPAALRSELKAVHKRYRNTEHPFALLETDAAQSKLAGLPSGEQRQALAAAFDAFNQVRDERLQLYRDVVPALSRWRAAGVPIVGYSAATSVNIAPRIRLLGLAGSFDRIYASPYAGPPYPGRSTRGRTADVPIVEMARPKPDPDAVPRITSDMGIPPEATLFVGDSIASDIAPAIEGGAKAALIRRQADSTTEWLPGLLEVSHRSAETRADSASLSDKDLVQVPTVTTLSDLWRHFTFGASGT